MDVKDPVLRAVIVTRERALPIKPFGIDMKVLLTTEATGGAISVILAWHKPGEGPPDHVHFSQEEMFFVVEGTYELTVGDQTSTVGPGTIAFHPPQRRAPLQERRRDDRVHARLESAGWTGPLLQ